MTQNIQCPECGSKLKVWFDVNAVVEFEVSPKGRLSKRTVVTSDTCEERYGVKCLSCDWEVHALDDEDDDYLGVFQDGCERVKGIQLSVKRV